MSRRPGSKARPRAQQEMLPRSENERRKAGGRTRIPVEVSPEETPTTKLKPPKRTPSPIGSTELGSTTLGSTELSRTVTPVPGGSLPSQGDPKVRSSLQKTLKGQRPAKGTMPTDEPQFIRYDEETHELVDGVLPATPVVPEPPMNPLADIRDAVDAERDAREEKIRSGGITIAPSNVSKLERLMEHTPHDYLKIIKYIEAGAFPYIAAEALGVTKRTFDTWMRRGSTQKKGVYTRFYQDVMRASARSRMVAELQVKKDDPRFWLTKGPGKSQGNRQGWTEQTEVTHTHQGGENPIAIEVTKSGFETPTTHDLAATLQALQETGLITLTPFAHNLIERMENDKHHNTGIPTTQEILPGMVQVPKSTQPATPSGLAVQPIDVTPEDLDYDE
jgi:hypothetical protein